MSWVLTDEDVGDAERKRSFDTDTTLPIGFVRIKTGEYANSGFDRGHVCPHGDRAFNEKMSFSTFIMTNIMPQAPNLNRKAWVQLEDYERDLAKLGNHLYIVAGPSGVGGVGSNGPAKDIGGRVVVPSHCWKVIVVVPAVGGLNDLKKVTAETRVIAVSMPNDDTTVTDEWKQYRVSVASIEKETGLRFFNRVRPDVAKALKQKVDGGPTPPAILKKYGD